jgi:hypothetical protein
MNKVMYDIERVFIDRYSDPVALPHDDDLYGFTASATREG